MRMAGLNYLRYFSLHTFNAQFFRSSGQIFTVLPEAGTEECDPDSSAVELL